MSTDTNNSEPQTYPKTPNVPIERKLTRLTKTHALELKQITKTLRETNYCITQAMDLETATQHLTFKQYLLETRNDILTNYKPTTQNIDIEQLARGILKNNLAKLMKKQQARTTDIEPPSTPESQRKVAAVKNEHLKLALKDNVVLKTTHHHYAGFYSDVVLPPTDKTVKIETKDGKTIVARKDSPVINFGYSGQDTIITVQPTALVDKEICDDIPTGSVVRNYETGEVTGLITSKMQMGHFDVYPIQDGFRHPNIHLNNRVTHQIKRKPIVYADKQFDTKQELVKYIAANPDKPTTYKSTLYTDAENKYTQLIIHDKGHTIANIQLRHRLINKYQKEPPQYKPYKQDTAHLSGL